MHRIVGSIAIAAVLGMFSASVLLHALPAAGAQAVVGVLAPSPSVSVTTLPQLPTVAPVQPTYAPTNQPAPAASGIVAPPGTVIQVVGDVADPRVLSLKDLQVMRRSSITLRVVDPDGKRRVHIYSGVLLRDLIASVSPIGPGGATQSTKAYALVEGIGGDSAIVAFPEFEEAFNNKQILVAYMEDGAPLPGPSIGQLIVPEDQSQGRFVAGISTIRIGSPTP
jgi:DMSO/TMAO reductase YedYZ molybdopterin-dependent catalytic subunit